MILTSPNHIRFINLLIKIGITIIITLLAAYPYIDGTSQAGILDEVVSIGVWPAIATGMCFFTAIAFYCRDLQHTLKLVKPENRKASPGSVWLMFLIPYNFFEDFFIVTNIANSLEQEAKNNEKLRDYKDFGLVTGLGWSAAQLLSLFPAIIGQIAGLIGIVLWIRHWIFIRRINGVLQPESSAKRSSHSHA